MKFTIHQGSRQGPRPYNQDRLAYSYSKDALLIVLADGMGGHRHGEVAAQLAVKTLTDAFQEEAQPKLKNPGGFLRHAIQYVHDAIGAVTVAQDMLEAPRTTIVAAILQDDHLYCAHVGDSRLYHFRQGQLKFKTEDHSLVQVLYNRGQLDKDDMLTHPQRHKIYNCLGGDKQPQIALTQTDDLFEGDTLLLCSDGLWSVLDDTEIADMLHRGLVTETVAALLDEAERRSQVEGDNMSAIGLQWGDPHHHLLAVSTVTMPLSATTTIMNPLTHQPGQGEAAAPADLTDDEIEHAIAEIQAALKKSARN
ncbi:MAG TPA: protein phosphatase 2C domain-containing protein [Methylophilaceae bacterium]|nr:protein phosphatase 2C domain-containing protein [Methylophilaceae bacterium]